MAMQNVGFISTNKANEQLANEQLVNSYNWSQY